MVEEEKNYALKLIDKGKEFLFPFFFTHKNFSFDNLSKKSKFKRNIYLFKKKIHNVTISNIWFIYIGGERNFVH